MADPGEGPGAPLFLDQNEARRAEKIFFEAASPPDLRVWMTAPPPPSEGLDSPLEAPPSNGTFTRLKRVGISLVEVYEREGKTVIPDCKNPWKDRPKRTDRSSYVFNGCEKVKKTFWFCDLFAFRRQCIYSN